MITYKLFLSFCDHIRLNFTAKGILIFSRNKLIIAGYPYYVNSAQNDNEAKP